MGMGKGLTLHSIELFPKTFPKLQTVEDGKGKAQRRLPSPGTRSLTYSRSSDLLSPLGAQALRSRPVPSSEPGQRVWRPEGHRTQLCYSQPCSKPQFPCF